MPIENDNLLSLWPNIEDIPACVSQPNLELLKKKLESSKIDSALIDRQLAALQSQDDPNGTLLTLRSVSRTYRENIENLKHAIRNTRSASRKLTVGHATKV
jgi:hypothetical protein